MRQTLVSLTHAARILGVSPVRMARVVNNGGIRPAHVNAAGESFYNLAEVEALIGHSTKASLTRSEITRARLEQSDARGMDSALMTLPELARSLMQADFAAVTIMDEDGRVEHMFYAGMTREQAEAIGPPPAGHGVLGRLGDNDGALRLDRITDHPKSVGFPPHHPPMQALLGIQVASEGGRKANLYVSNGPDRPAFTEADELKLATLAQYVTLALDNAHLYTEEAIVRQRAESAERRLEAVIQGSSAGVVVVDAHTGDIIYASSEARRMTGLELARGSGRSAYEVSARYLRQDGSPFRVQDLPLQRAIAEKQRNGPVEVVFAHDDGRRIPALVSAAPILDRYGQVDTAVVVFMDMTRLKELDRVKEDFLSMVTHDLRSPLAAIKGLNAAAIDAFEGGNMEELRGNLQSVDEELDYLTELVSNLLDMSRIEAGAAMFEFEVCHMTDIAHDVVARMRHAREARGREIHLNVPASLPPIFADPSQVGRVLANLLSNALKYSGGTVEVSTYVDQDRKCVRTEVRDYGPGIPAERQQEIFNKFARLMTGKTRGREGSGLGLAICKSIVESHRGEISVESVEGSGSTFWFSLPAEEATGQ